MKKLLSLAMTAALLCAGSLTAEAAYTPGTYTGTSPNGKNGDVTVSVTFDADRISSIDVTEHAETAGISDAAIEQIPAAIVENQSLAVDAVAGATVTSAAILEAVEDAVQQAGGDAEALKAKTIEKESSTEVVEKHATVVIAGAGAAGMTAAMTAITEGAESVIVVEKQAMTGGNAIVSGGWVENIHEELRPENNEGYEAAMEAIFEAGPQNPSEEAIWDEFKADYEAFKASGSTKVYDRVIWHALDLARSDGLEFSGTEAPEFLLDWVDWFTEGTDAQWNSPTNGIVGYSWPRWSSLKGYVSGQGYFDLYDRWIKNSGANIEFLTGTPMTDLIEDETGKVVGLVAADQSGTTYHIYADRGVMLCTGGYAANIEMVRETDGIWGELLPEDIITTNSSGDTGDGILIAQEHGAAVDGMDNTMLFPMANIHTGSTESIVGLTASALLVNQEGQRFVNETLDRYTISGAILAQTDGIAYIISSSENACITDGKTLGGEDVERLIENGELFRADTIEELCEQTGIDAANLAGTIETYNTSCNTFTDEAFGRTTFEEGSAVLTAPFYAYPCKPATHITMGGLLADADGHVYNDALEMIPGLYAAGEITAYNLGVDGSFAYGRQAAKAVMAE